MLRALPKNGRCLQNHRLAKGLYATIMMMMMLMMMLQFRSEKYVVVAIMITDLLGKPTSKKIL
jgi:hypothetical protein